MKARWFLRGLGIGIVVTALVLCITYRNDRHGNDIIRQAKELGMVFPKNETEDVSDSDQETTQDEPEDEKPEDEKPEDQKPETKEDAVSGAAVKEEAGKDSEADKKAKDRLDKSSGDITGASKYHGNAKSFVVRSGLLSSSVAREMEAAGIIDDADSFDEFIEKNGYGKLVRSGKYEIPNGADYETIAKIITRQ